MDLQKPSLGQKTLGKSKEKNVLGNPFSRLIETIDFSIKVLGLRAGVLKSLPIWHSAQEWFGNLTPNLAQRLHIDSLGISRVTVNSLELTRPSVHEP